MDRDLIEMIKRHEGWREKAYNDVNGKAIGYGFYLSDPITKRYLPKDVLAGRRPLTKAEADQILIKRIKRAEEDAKAVIGADVWQRLGANQKKALIDMAYQHGQARFKQYKKMIRALREGDYERAAYEMRDSKWYRTYTTRAREIVNLFYKDIKREAQNDKQ